MYMLTDLLLSCWRLDEFAAHVVKTTVVLECPTKCYSVLVLTVLVLTVTGRGCALMDPSNSITYKYLAKHGLATMTTCTAVQDSFLLDMEQFADGELLQIIDVQHG